jgi:hypothetical protein
VLRDLASGFELEMVGAMLEGFSATVEPARAAKR